jgi:predicted 2-oxoglutarate/Fe(II)-dependent dioxygenase YbiX
MLHFPVRSKPDIDFSEYKAIAEYPGVITKEMANDIIQLVTSSTGWHRRGSKTPELTQASFTTCLLLDLDHPIYELLDPIWKLAVEEHGFDVSFIEYYEIKEYLPGDEFGMHIDSYIGIDAPINRTLNMIIHLNDPSEYEGGQLTLGRRSAPKTFGTAIFFPAGYPHAVSEVTSGKRYILIGHAWGPMRIS